MTDRHSGYVIALSEDVREDDAEFVLNAIRMIKGVASVEPVVSDPGTQVAQARRDRAWQDCLWELARNGIGEGVDNKQPKT